MGYNAKTAPHSSWTTGLLFALALLSTHCSGNKTEFTVTDTSTGSTDTGADAAPGSDTENSTDTNDDTDTAPDTETGQTDTDTNTQRCVRYVDVNQTSTAPDGLTFATAFSRVQDGIDAAKNTVDTTDSLSRCHVWVAKGTYYIHETLRTNTVLLKPGVYLFGGFSGAENRLTERDHIKNETILDGHKSAGSPDQVYHVVTGSGDTLLDGFTITGGKADTGPFDDKGGA